MKLWLVALAAVSALSFWVPAPLHAGTLPDISGTWYSGGDRTKRCRIEQSGTSVTLRNEDGWTATGRFVNPSEITTTWGAFGAGTTITGRISGDLQTIRWSNGTYWTRAGGRPEPTGWRSGKAGSATAVTATIAKPSTATLPHFRCSRRTA